MGEGSNQFVNNPVWQRALFYTVTIWHGGRARGAQLLQEQLQDKVVNQEGGWSLRVIKQQLNFQNTPLPFSINAVFWRMSKTIKAGTLHNFCKNKWKGVFIISCIHMSFSFPGLKSCIVIVIVHCHWSPPRLHNIITSLQCRLHGEIGPRSPRDWETSVFLIQQPISSHYTILG